MKNVTESQSLKVIEVNGKERFALLVRHFGHVCIEFESILSHVMQEICPKYVCGYWRFFELENGAFYMVPAEDNSYQFEVNSNGFKGLISQEAAGIVATILTLNYMLMAHKTKKLVYKFYLLLDYAMAHEESDAIFAALAG